VNRAWGVVAVIVFLAGAGALAVFGERRLEDSSDLPATTLVLPDRGFVKSALLTSGESRPTDFAWRVTVGRRDRPLYGGRFVLQPGEARRIPLPELPSAVPIVLRASARPTGPTRALSFYAR
jgi:hypothetical protein